MHIHAVAEPTYCRLMWSHPYKRRASMCMPHATGWATDIRARPRAADSATQDLVAVLPCNTSPLREQHSTSTRHNAIHQHMAPTISRSASPRHGWYHKEGVHAWGQSALCLTKASTQNDVMHAAHTAQSCRPPMTRAMQSTSRNS
jgi:hypothetical protein